MAMTQEEALKCFRQIEGYEVKQIRELVAKELCPNCGFGAIAGAKLGFNIGTAIGTAIGAEVGAAFGLSNALDTERQQEELETICKDTIKKNSSTIKEILQKHPNYTNYVIDIIMLLAPAIAQQYLGISAMAIVGSITIICKQGINAYLQ